MPRPDQHDEVELNYLPEGSLTYLMAGHRQFVPARRLVAFWATVPHQIVEHEGETPYFVATIPFAWFLKWRVPDNLHNRILQWEMVIDVDAGDSDRDHIMFEHWIQDADDDLLAPAVALEIQARLLRMAKHLDDGSETDPQALIPTESQDKAELMAVHISRGYRERLTIPDIAQNVDLHPDYAASLFKKTYGTTIVTFITRFRVAHAQRLLLTTNDQIINIAMASGFESVSRFNRAFRKFAGLTPSAYRKARR